MATNKHATIRYHALDRCFSNFGRRFFIEDLIEACNQAIYDFDGIEDGVKRRQIFDDINFMESDQAVRKAREAHHTIVLIDGDKLVDLMHEYNVGIQVKDVYEVKELDNDFFEGE